MPEIGQLGIAFLPGVMRPVVPRLIARMGLRLRIFHARHPPRKRDAGCLCADHEHRVISMTTTPSVSTAPAVSTAPSVSTVTAACTAPSASRLASATRWPSLFVSHGAPTYAMDPGLAGAQLKELGHQLGRPRAIVVVSPHWMTRNVEVTGAPRPSTVHDFGGFPRALFALQYPAPGAPELAAQIRQQLASAGIAARLDTQRGLDHGAWVPLLHLYPGADVPTVQVSLPIDADEHSALALGKALAPLAVNNVLIVGSGSLTHNLSDFRMDEGESAPLPYTQEFSAWVRQAVTAKDLGRLIQALTLAPHAARAHPTSEHFLPLFVALGAAHEAAKVTILDGGIRHRALAMESYLFGDYPVRLPNAV